MKLLELESHFFSAGNIVPVKEDVPSLMQAFSDLDLLPQYFNEALSPVTTAKQLMFSNNIDNVHLRFLSNKAMVSKTFNPWETQEGDERALDSFKSMSLSLMSSYQETKGGYEYNRLSLVARYTIFDKEGKVKELLRENISSLPWVEAPLSEVGLRTATIKKIGEEEINCIISLNDGKLERVLGAGRELSDCLILEFDINTSQHNTRDRFDVARADGVISEILKILQERVGCVSTFAP